MPKRLIYITIEYCLPDIFSGNGVCAQSQVRGLLQSFEVHVICGRPADATDLPPLLERLTIHPVHLDVWFTTDRPSAHRQFANHAAKILDAFDWHNVQACFAVDWTGMNVLHAANPHTKNRILELCIPVMYLSFRSYVSMTGISENDRAFYRTAESNAVRYAIHTGGGVVSLSSEDDKTLKSLHPASSDHQFCVILPMLRDEFAAIAERDEDIILNFDRPRMYLVSLVRLSEDKGPHRFVSLLKLLQSTDPSIWSRLGVVPLLCGAASQPEYAAQLKADLLNTVPSAVIMDTFLSPSQLATVLQSSILNIHPSLYEGYGLTIVEAAAMGCPSVVNETGIGATQLLMPEAGAVVSVDISDIQKLADTVKRILENDMYRQRLSEEAYMRAVSWTEEEHVAELVNFTKQRMSCNCANRQHTISLEH